MSNEIAKHKFYLIEIINYEDRIDYLNYMYTVPEISHDSFFFISINTITVFSNSVFKV